MEKRLLGVEEAAQYLGIQKGTLYFWAHKRMISTVKMGRRLLFDRNDLDDHIEQGKRRPTEVLADNKAVTARQKDELPIARLRRAVK